MSRDVSYIFTLSAQKQMGSQLYRCAFVLPVLATRYCSGSIRCCAHARHAAGPTGIRRRSGQRSCSHGWSERRWFEVCFHYARLEPYSLVFLSFSNFTLKYVDASFYQVARGMVLPFTVMTSYVFLHSRPSTMVLLACSVVTLGFFIGVFLDGTQVSLVGVSFGVASSMITAMHSVVIKKSLEVVKGSALHLSWYTNLLSAVVLLPIIFLAGEGPAVYNLLFSLHVVPVGGVSPLTAFLWGSAITVSETPLALYMDLIQYLGCVRFLDEYRKLALHQGYLAHYAHGFVCCPWSRCLNVGCVAVP